jgi:ribonuclease VapC
MFVDASALTAILLGEPEQETFLRKMATSSIVLVSSIAVWETSVVVATRKPRPFEQARQDLIDLLTNGILASSRSARPSPRRRSTPSPGLGKDGTRRR